jgi:4-alpha-glucanotransferase
MATVTTHDLPTVAGLWTGSDLEEQREQGAGSHDQLVEGREQLLDRLTGPSGLDPAASPAEAVVAAYRLLASAPSTLLAATLEDAVGEERRPNIPGTTQRPNWSYALPVRVDDLADHELVKSVTSLLAEAVPSPPPPPEETS